MSSEPDAARILAALAKRNTVAHDLGVELVEARLGSARLAMVVQDRMVGGHGVCQGGYIFTLADMCGAYACLSHNRQTLTQTAHITRSPIAGLKCVREQEVYALICEVRIGRSPIAGLK